MSRMDGRFLEVTINEDGEPISFQASGFHYSPVVVLSCRDHWREWLDTLGIVTPGGESERDVWLVETSEGCCELHHLHPPDTLEGGQWILYRWED